jgi:YesN/AraC family two-component response regulator
MGKEMKITDYSKEGFPNWVISSGVLICNFNKVVMKSGLNLFLYNAVSDNEEEDQYVGLIDHNGITEALEQMQELGIKVIDERKPKINPVVNNSKTIRQQFEDQRPFIEDCAREGMTMAQIAKRLDVTPMRLANAFKSLDISINRLRSEGSRL